jgi:autotransporter-associated beta strand protein
VLRFISAAIFFLTSSYIYANEWIVSSGDWSEPTSWGGAVPRDSDNAFISNGGTATITKSDEKCFYLYLGGTLPGTVEMIGGSFYCHSLIGVNGIGTFNQSGGYNGSDITIYENGTYNLNGSAELVTPGEIIGYSVGLTGDGGIATFNQSAGTNTITYNNDGLSLGLSSDVSAIYNLSGTGQLNSLVEFIGCRGGIGIFNQSAGTNTIISGGYSELSIGKYPGSNGTYNLSGTGQLSAITGISVGDAGTGTFNQSGGINTSIDIDLGGNSSSIGTYNFTGGILITKWIGKGGGNAAFNFGGGTLQASDNFTSTMPMTLTGDGGNANVDTAGYTVGLSGVLSGTGGLNKFNSGTLTLSALNTYSGDTIVNGGTLEIAHGIAAIGTSLIDVQSGTSIMKTVSVNKPNLNITTAALATFEVVNGIYVIGTITGSGITKVDTGAILTAASICQDTLTIGSGTMVTIEAIAGEPQDYGITAVPEPNAILLLSVALIMLWYTWARKVKD